MSSRRPGADLVIAANRLPVQVEITDGQAGVEPSPGGLAAALRGLGARAWVGWPGSFIPPAYEDDVRARLETRRLVPVFLGADEEERFYNRICNGAMWPLFHYLPGRFSFDHDDWDRYVDVNERFAEMVAELCPHGGRAWVHDFQLMLVPQALRRRRPDLSIGFFLHVPFPSSEIYRLLPRRREVLLGILGADYVGFHVGDYVRHFRSSCLRVLGLESAPDAIEHEGRLVRVGANPIGIDVQSFHTALADPETARVAAELEERYAGRRLILGVERLDYSKGVPQKLLAFERFLERDPARAATTTMLQVIVPSRLENPEYRAQRDEIEGLVSRVNGRFGQPGRTPLEYLHRSVSSSELVALYRRADVMAVTPLRDGMNLVAQEFVLCQSAASPLPGAFRGVLLLSEMAGSAQILPGALLVNPWDVDDIVDRLTDALDFDADERRRRLGLMAARVERLDSRRWAEGFLSRLGRVSRREGRRRAVRPLAGAVREAIARRFARARHRTLFLDYDGTLRELVGHPDLARPTREVLDLLQGLARLPETHVHVVSGRTRDSLEAWLGDLSVHLCAEHGYLARAPGEDWRKLVDVDLTWLPRVHRLFTRVAADVPGTVVERKTCAVTWHYRQAEPEYGAWRARELLPAVETLLRGAPAEIMLGQRIVEVRARGVSKGGYVHDCLPTGRRASHAVLAAGDDRTDLDLYAALPRGSVAIHVGKPLADVREVVRPVPYGVDSPQALRGFLRELLEAAGSGP
jgi:trehalose 6-phosphate synthase/phosphatase